MTVFELVEFLVHLTGDVAVFAVDSEFVFEFYQFDLIDKMYSFCGEKFLIKCTNIQS